MKRFPAETFFCGELNISNYYISFGKDYSALDEMASFSL